MSYTPPPPPPEQGGTGSGATPPGSGATPPGYGAPPPPPGYGAPPPPGYGPPAPGGYGVPKNSTKAVVALVLGVLAPVLGLCCGVFGLVGIAAIVLGRQAQREIAASGGLQTGAGLAKIGYVLGIVGTVIGTISLALVVYQVATGGLVLPTDPR